MTGKEKGLIFNIQHFILHDGPGIRTNIFFKGCPLHCKWCHNPEGINPFPEILFREFQCIHNKNCIKCINSCSVNAIKYSNESIIINRSKCNLCEECVKICDSNALEICGQYMSVEDIMKEVLSDKVFFEQSGGGVTLSGGEPLLQFNFVKEFLKEARYQELNTCLDTTGYVETKKFKEIMNLVDLFLYDVKCLDEERHEQLTGKSNNLILKNLKICLDHHCNLIVRVPIIPGYNFMNLSSELENYLIQLAEMGITSFELIPYHEFGVQKYKMLGREYPLSVKKLELNQLPEYIKKIREKHGSLMKEIHIKISKPILT
ncbi:MAG: glycyl-radical enzyme activating protein [Promethearchaeota archaeon]